MKASLRQLCHDLLEYFFPRYCVVCGRRLSEQEQHLCLSCYRHLPRTMYHTAAHGEMEKTFWGQIPIERALPFFHYTFETKRIISYLKYKNRPEIGIYLSSQFVKEVKHSGFFDTIDIIVPLPLHRKKYKSRGYNQTEYIAQGINRETHIPVCTEAVERIINNETQTHLLKSQRKANVEGAFRLVHPEMLQSKHVLLVDDVMTTGSTLLSCAIEIAKAPDVKISIMTLAIAGHSLVSSDDDDTMPYISIDPNALSRL